MQSKQGMFYSLKSSIGSRDDTLPDSTAEIDTFWLMVDEPTRVLDKETGRTLLILDRERLNDVNVQTAYNILQPVAKSNANSNRGIAGGYLDMNKVYKSRPNFQVGRQTDFRVYPMKRDGTLGKTHYCNPVSSSIIGWTDIPKRDERSVKCRLTAFSAKQFDRYSQTFPFFEEIDTVYKELAPTQYAFQKEFAADTTAVVGKTVFSTITVNYNWRSALHKDAGDYKGGFGAFTVIQSSTMGGELLFPEYGVAVRVRTGDVLLFDSHLWHCNAPVMAESRLTFVCYMRSNIPTNCQDKRSSRDPPSSNSGG